MNKSLADVSVGAAAAGGYLAGWLLGAKGILLAVLLFAAFFVLNHLINKEN